MIQERGGKHFRGVYTWNKVGTDDACFTGER